MVEQCLVISCRFGSCMRVEYKKEYAKSKFLVTFSKTMICTHCGVSRLSVVLSSYCCFCSVASLRWYWDVFEKNRVNCCSISTHCSCCEVCARLFKALCTHASVVFFTLKRTELSDLITMQDVSFRTHSWHSVTVLLLFFLNSSKKYRHLFWITFHWCIYSN